MIRNYNFNNIRNLLTEGFSEAELRRLSFDVPDFQPVYNDLAQNAGKADIIDHILDYARQKVKIEALLEWAQECNPNRYKQFEPYYSANNIEFVPPPPKSSLQLTDLIKIVAVLGVIILIIFLLNFTLGSRVASFAGFIAYFLATFWLTFKAKDISRVLRLVNLGIFYGITVLYFIWVGTWIITHVPVSSSPPVSLVSITYDVDDFNPRKVDLRTASTSGIPVTAGHALRLSDLWFSATEDAPIYGVQAEIYANDRLLGSTPPKPLIAGLTKLDSVKIEDYIHDNYPTSWYVQPDWKDLQVFLITYRAGEIVNRNLTIIHLAADGTAWFIDPPNVNFVSIVYTVNDGPEIVLDVRDAETAGLRAGPGDKLTLQEIWYDSNADRQDYTVQAEIYLFTPPEGFNRETDQATLPNVVRQGIHKLNSIPLSWTIADDKRFIDLTLFRSDGTVMDMLILPLGL